MKRILVLALTLALALSLAACGDSQPAASAATGSEPETQATTAATEAATEPPTEAPTEELAAEEEEETPASAATAMLGFITQEYIDGSIAEIPYIEYEGDTNPEIDMINRALDQGLQQTYEEFMANNTEGYTTEIRSYPFTDEEYLQVVITDIMFPAYGTDGNMQSFNYSKAENRFISLDDAMTDAGLTAEAITQKVEELYVPEYPAMYVGEVKPAGFLVRGDTLFLLDVTIENPDGEPWKSFYSYAPASDELTKLDGRLLFVPAEMDQPDPPLSYQRFQSDAAQLMTEMLADKLEEGKTLLETGIAEIGGSLCLTFELGEDSPEKFTAEEHYAVGSGLEVYAMDASQSAEWTMIQ